MEMTRKEILNSSEYWQERAETQCYIEGIDCTIQLVDKQQLIDKAAEWVEKYLFEIGYPDDWLRDSLNTTNGETRFKQALKGE